MTNNPLDKLFQELHESYLNTMEFHLKKSARTGYTSGMQLHGDWVSALPNPHESEAKIDFRPHWRSDWSSIRHPEWLSLTRIESTQLRIIRSYKKDLILDKILLELIYQESYGLWVLFLKNLYIQQINQKRMIYRELAYLELLCPNIFSVAAEIVSVESFGTIKKTISSIRDLDQKSLENKTYSYISGIKKLRHKKTISYTPIIKSKDYNWTSEVYPPSFPITFNLTKIEATVLVAHELFKLEILPLLRFTKLRRRKCSTCSRNFDPNKEIDWFGVALPVLCSICLQMATNTKLLVYEQFNIPRNKVKLNAIAGIKEFERVFGFIPASNFDRKAALSSLITKDRLKSKQIEIIKALCVLPRHDTAKKYFGSWAHLLHAAGVLEKSKTSYGGYRSIGSDAHICLSIGERLICETLTNWKITHTKEPVYPFDADLNPKKLLRADFKVKNILIEYAGRMSSEAYAKQMAKKIELAKKKNLQLIVLERIDEKVLDDLRKRLDRK